MRLQNAPIRISNPDFTLNHEDDMRHVHNTNTAGHLRILYSISTLTSFELDCRIVPVPALVSRARVSPQFLHTRTTLLLALSL